MPATDYEIQIRAAIRAVQLGMPLRAAAKQYGVPRSNLQRRFEGIPTRKETNRDLQILSPALEGQLAHWIIGQARLGFAPSFVKFRAVAQRLLLHSNSHHTIGQHWYEHFLHRNSSVRTARSCIINYNRVNGATVENINLFFDRLDAPEIASIGPDRFYNTDEMGVGQGVGGDHWVLTDCTLKKTLKKDVDRGKWITTLECISGDGRALPPLVIFSGVYVQSQWFPDQNQGLWDDWRFHCTPKGWTSNPTALNWLQDIFIPSIRAYHGNIWVVLISDGHESHTSDDFLWLCLINKVWLVFYEPHCSHVVQALDVGVFSLLKKKLKNLLRESISATLGLQPTKQEVLVAYRQARIEVLKPSVIRNAWKTAGIYPRDRSKPLSSKYVVLTKKGVAKVAEKDPTEIERPKTPNFLAEIVKTHINTPSGGQDLRLFSQKLFSENPTAHAAAPRLLFRKAAKALDLKDQKIADLQAKVDNLEAKVAKSVNTHRQSVKVTPGQRFVRMADVRRRKRELRSRTIYEDEARDQEVPRIRVESLLEEERQEEDCIIVQTAN